MKKFKMVLISTVAFILSFTGCKNNNAALSTAVAYNNALLAGNFSTAYSYTNLTQYEFVTEDDFAAIYSADYFYKTEVPVNAEFIDGVMNITYKDKSVEQIPAEMSNNGYIFNMTDLLITDYEIPVLKGGKLYISNSEVGVQYIEYSDEVYDYYYVDLAPVIYDITISSDTFGSIDMKLNPLEEVVEASGVSNEVESEIISSFNQNLQAMYDLIESEPNSKRLQSLLPESYEDSDLFNEFQMQMKQNRNIDSKYTSYHDVNVIVEKQKDATSEMTAENVISIPCVITISWVIGEDYQYEYKYDITLDLTDKPDIGWKLYSDACVDELFNLKVR